MAPRRSTFGWTDTARRLEDARRGGDVAFDDGRRALIASGPDGTRRIVPPAVLPIPADARDVVDYLDALPTRLPTHVVLLVQAGASALGAWDGDELVRHKVIKKYVVRGQGRAQPTHLKTRGKSRYGSRLRLQNARAQLDETNAKLAEFTAALPAVDLAFHSVPVRMWHELFRAEPPPPFAADDARWTKIRMHVHVPDFEELRRVQRALLRGSIEDLSTDGG